MLQRVLVPVLLVVLLVLVVLCARHHAPAIQGDIEGRARIAMLAAGFSDEMVRCEGRLVVLSGSVHDVEERDAAHAAVLAVKGVRGVRGGMVVDPGGPPGRATRLLRARVRDGRLYLAGRIAAAGSLQDLIAQAHRAWRAAPVVVEELEPHGVPAEPWPDLYPLFRVLKERGEGTDILYRNGRLDLRGQVLSEVARERLAGALRVAYPAWTIRDALVLRAPATPLERLQVELDALLRNSSIEFVADSDALTDQGRAALDRLVAPLRAATGRVEISGHTDSRGDPVDNQDLSERRARNVKNYLSASGVPPARLAVAGYGASRPIADNATPGGQQRNRRIEFRTLRED